MASPWQSEARPSLMMNSEETGPQSIAGRGPGDVEAGQHSPSRSKTMTGGAPQYSSPPRCGHPWDHPPVPGYGAMQGQEPWQPGALHDSRVPPDRPCPRLVQHQPGTPRGGTRFATSHRGLLGGWRVPGIEGCEGRGEGQDPSNRFLAASPGYGRRWG